MTHWSWRVSLYEEQQTTFWASSENHIRFLPLLACYSPYCVWGLGLGGHSCDTVYMRRSEHWPSTTQVLGTWLMLLTTVACLFALWDISPALTSLLSCKTDKKLTSWLKWKLLVEISIKLYTKLNWNKAWLCKTVSKWWNPKVLSIYCIPGCLSDALGAGHTPDSFAQMTLGRLPPCQALLHKVGILRVKVGSLF